MQARAAELYEKYENLYDLLVSIIQVSEQRVISEEPDDLFSDNVNFFVKSYMSKRSIVSVIHNPLPAMSEFPNSSFLGITYDINRKQYRSQRLADSHRAMASIWFIPSKLLPPASTACSPV